MAVVLLADLVTLVKEVLNVIHLGRCFLKVFHAASEVAIYYVVSHEANQCHTDEVCERKPAWVCQQGVPQADGRIHFELLAEQQHEPPYGVKLMVDLVLFDAVVGMWFDNLHDF